MSSPSSLPPSDPFFALASQSPAAFANGWRIVRVDTELVKITFFEISADTAPTSSGEAREVEIIKAHATRGSFILTRAGLAQFAEFAQKSLSAWKELDKGTEDFLASGGLKN